MKKKIVFLLSLVMILSVFLCGCGKSEEVKNVENLINSLNASSTYKEINEVYKKYNGLDYEEQEKVDNTDVLKKYCNISNGHFVLTDDMLEEIKLKFSEPSFEPEIWETQFDFELSNDMRIEVTAHEMVSGDWDSFEKIKTASREQEDDYSYVTHGTVVIVDKYGEKAQYEFDYTYFSEYDEEQDTYKISNELSVKEYTKKEL